MLFLPMFCLARYGQINIVTNWVFLFFFTKKEREKIFVNANDTFYLSLSLAEKRHAFCHFLKLLLKFTNWWKHDVLYLKIVLTIQYKQTNIHTYIASGTNKKNI